MQSETKYPARPTLPGAKASRRGKAASLIFLLSILTTFCPNAPADDKPNVEPCDLVNIQVIESAFEAKGRPVEYSYSEEFEKERQIVRRIISIRYNGEIDGHQEKPRIGIAMVDLNNDGADDILAVVDSEMLFGRIGCIGVAVINQGGGKWQELYGMPRCVYSAVMPTRHRGYSDLLVHGPIKEYDDLERAWKKTGESKIICRFDGLSYQEYLKRDRRIDPATGLETVSTWMSDMRFKPWRLIDER